MGRSFTLMVICLMLLGSHLHAEPETLYQLHDPTADEYLAALPRIMKQAELDYATDGSPNYAEFVNLTWAEVQTRYTPLSDYPYDLLAAVYPYYTINYIGGINTDLVAAWLRENTVDLDDFDTEHTLNFGDMVIKITRRDFNADGQHEWVLDINQGDRYKWREVLSRTTAGIYEQIKTPLFVFDGAAQYSLSMSGFAEELAFKDLNQDGLPEWVIAVGGIGGGHRNHGFLYILQWHDGELINLISQEERISYSSPAGGGGVLFPYGVTVELGDIDNNGSIEIQIKHEKYDNWGCTWTQTRVFGWKDDRYTLFMDIREDHEVKGCAWGTAEAAMWESNYLTAITHYERALILPFAEDFTSDYRRDYTNDLWEYTQVRLALAYVLANRPSNAKAILRSLQDAGIKSGAAQQMSNTLLVNIGYETPEDICQAVYDLWFSYIDAPREIWETDAMEYSERIPTRALIGYTAEFEPNSNWPSIPKPEKAGCDITAYGHSLSKTSYARFLEEIQSPIQIPPPSNNPNSIYYRNTAIYSFQVVNAIYAKNDQHFLSVARLWLMNIQHGVKGDEWQARYLLAAALRRNNRLEEALEQYVYIQENSPLASWRQLAGLYLRPVESQ